MKYVVKIGITSLFISILLLTIAVRSCPKRNKNRVGSSNAFIVNAPLNLIATAVSPSQINLSWQDNSSNENWFELERRVSVGGNWQSVVTATITFYSDTGLIPYTTYYYRVRASNIIGDNSDWSNEANATTWNIVWSSIRGGEYHSLALTNLGTVYSWGANASGQLGFNDTNDRFIPTPIMSDYYGDIFEGIAAIAGAQGNHSLGVKRDGTIWSWGRNDYGQLGVGDTLTADAPYLIGVDTDWSFAVTGFTNSMAIKKNRTIWGWGSNGSGELGIGDNIDRWTPSQAGTDSDWSVITLGWMHTIGIKTNGTIWSWGDNLYGQLGYSIGRLVFTPSQIGSGQDWIAAAAGNNNSFALKTNGTLWSWGVNGQELSMLGIGNTEMNWTSNPSQIGDSDWLVVSGINLSTISINTAIKTNRTIWAWGGNGEGQLGFGDTETRPTPDQIGTDSDWSAVATGVGHTIAFKTNVTMWAWGANEFGQLGVGDTTNRSTPTQTGILMPDLPSGLVATGISSQQVNLTWFDLSYNEEGFKIERKTSSTSYSLIATVGYNITFYSDITPAGFAPNTTYYYRVRAFNGFGDSLPSNEVFVIPWGDWSIVALGGTHSLALKTNNTIWSWGFNNRGQLGLGYTNQRVNTPTQIVIGTDTDWSAVAGGSLHTIAFKTNNTIWSWGLNDKGQLGLGDTINRNTPSLIGTYSGWTNIVAGANHAISFSTNGAIWAWGDNQYGQLGIGNTISKTTPTLLGAETDWSIITTKGDYSICLKTDGTIWGWGYNGDYELGLTDTTDRWTPTRIGSDTDWSVPVAGDAHTIVHKINSTLWGWGSNYSGQLGLGDTEDRWTPTQIGVGSDWSTVAIGGEYTIALKNNRTIWAWGRNNVGQLGLGDTGSRYTPTQVTTEIDWATVKAGGAHSIARKLNGTIWSWGRNSNGQLGLGDSVDKNTPTLVAE